METTEPYCKGTLLADASIIEAVHACLHQLGVFSASFWSENALQQRSWLWLLDSFVALLSFWLDWFAPFFSPASFALLSDVHDVLYDFRKNSGKKLGKNFIHLRVNWDLSKIVQEGQRIHQEKKSPTQTSDAAV